MKEALVVAAIIVLAGLFTWYVIIDASFEGAIP